MAYSHKLVSAVQDRELKTPEDWSVMVQTLDEFAFAVKRALRMGDLRFAQAGNYGVYVYRPHDRFTMGRLDVRHDAVPADYGRMEYSVYSRNIKNKRYNDYNADRYTKKSTDMKKAVKHALAYLRPYKPVETAQRHGLALSNFINKEAQDLWSAQRSIVKDFVGERAFDSREYMLDKERLGVDEFEAELRHLVQSGHQFVNPEIGTKLRQFFETKQLRERADKAQHNMVYLRVYDLAGAQLADMATLPNRLVNNLFSESLYKDYLEGCQEVTGVPVEQLSESVTGNVGVLSMLEPEDGVAGVGYRASDSEFFIYPQVEQDSE
jgi:hypothetical protein